MNNEVYYPMSQKQLGRYVTISGLIEKQLTVKEAAISLGLSTRQILRLACVTLKVHHFKVA